MHPSPELLALIALGGHNEATQADLDHVAGCTLCAAEVADLARLVALGRSTHGTGELQEPPAYVWDRILTEIATDAPQSTAVATDAPAAWAADAVPNEAGAHVSAPVSAPAPTSGDNVVPLPRRRRRWPAITAAAAALALLVGGAIGFGIARTMQPGTTVLARAELSALPSWSGSSATAVLRRNADGQRILTLDLAASKPLSGTQAVWLIDPSRPDEPMQVGLLDLNKGIWSVPSDVDVARYRMIDVSEEPVGDTDLRHSGNSIVRGPLE